MKNLVKVLLVLSLIVGLNHVAHADPIMSGTLSLTNCGTAGTGCPGATYSFTIGSNSATLTIHIDGPVTAGVNDLIGSVNLGFTTQTLNGLNGTTTAGSGWSFTTGSLNNGGCGSNGDPAACAAYTNASGGVLITQGSTFSWTWNWTNSLTASDLIPRDKIHIGANYNPANGLIVSQTVPEPSTLLLLGTGLIGIAGLRRRRT